MGWGGWVDPHLIGRVRSFSESHAPDAALGQGGGWNGWWALTGLSGLGRSYSGTIPHLPTAQERYNVGGFHPTLTQPASRMECRLHSAPCSVTAPYQPIS